MISKELKKEWANKANNLYQKENDTSKVLHKGTLTKILSQVTGHFTDMNDETFLLLEHGDAIDDFLDDLCRDPVSTTATIVGYLKRTL